MDKPLLQRLREHPANLDSHQRTRQGPQLLREAVEHIARLESQEMVTGLYAHQLDLAWGLVTSVGGGDWSKESEDWQFAATKWREALERTAQLEASNAAPPVV